VGVLVTLGAVLQLVNVVQTIRKGERLPVETEAVEPAAPAAKAEGAAAPEAAS
jgi:hypothetical protein